MRAVKCATSPAQSGLVLGFRRSHRWTTPSNPANQATSSRRSGTPLGVFKDPARTHLSRAPSKGSNPVKVAESALQRARGEVDYAGKRRGNRRFGRSGNSRLVLLPEALCDSETSRFGPVLEEAQNPVNNHRNRMGRNSDATYGGFRPSPEPTQTGNPQNRTMSGAVARFGRLRAARIEDSLVFFQENRLLRAPEGGPNSDPHEEMATRAARGRGRPGAIPGAVGDSGGPAAAIVAGARSVCDRQSPVSRSLGIRSHPAGPSRREPRKVDVRTIGNRVYSRGPSQNVAGPHGSFSRSSRLKKVLGLAYLSIKSRVSP